MEITKEVIEKIEQLCKPFIHIAQDGTEYFIDKEDGITHLKPDMEYPAEIRLHSLDALVQMVKSEAVSIYDSPVYLEAKGYNNVGVFLQIDTGMRCFRTELYNVVASDVPGWKEETELPYEQALIAIRTRFQQTNDTAYLLKLLSEISNGAKVTFAENGIATTVITKQGVDLQGNVPIRPIITLKPYRTFQEIEQPASEFHIRISERGIKFIEADGGMWKLEARRTIVAHLIENLTELIDAGRVFVML